MLFHLCCWAVVGVPCLMLGSLIERRSALIGFCSRTERAMLSFYLGLILLSSVLLTVSLAFPATPIELGAVITVMVVFTLLEKQTRKQFLQLSSPLVNRSTLVGVLILLMMAAYASAGQIKVYDTGLYHYPVARWLATTGTVPGMALLWDNLGFASTWYALAAGFDHGPFRGRVAGIFNGLVTVVAIIHFSLALSRAIQRRGSMPDWFLLGAYPIVFALCYELNYSSSLSPDLPAFVITILVGWRILREGYSSGRMDSFRSNVPLLILASGIVDLKLSGVPVLITVLLLISARSHFQLRQVVPAVLTASAIVAPVLLANLVTSGYVLFPSLILGLRLPWSLSPAAVTRAAGVITNWARCNGPCTYPAVGLSWVIPWVHAPQNALMLLMSACALVLFILLRAWRFGKHIIWVLVLGELGIFYVVLMAPNARFAAGYLAVCSGLSVGLVSLKGRQSHHCFCPAFSYSLAIAFCLELSLLAEPYFRGMSYAEPGAYAQLLIPGPVPIRTSDIAIMKDRRHFREAPITLVTEKVNGINYLRPVGSDQCWDADVPCVPGEVSRGIVLRNPKLGLRAGFVQAPRLH